MAISFVKYIVYNFNKFVFIFSVFSLNSCLLFVRVRFHLTLKHIRCVTRSSEIDILVSTNTYPKTVFEIARRKCSWYPTGFYEVNRIRNTVRHHQLVTSPNNFANRKQRPKKRFIMLVLARMCSPEKSVYQVVFERGFLHSTPRLAGPPCVVGHQ